MHDVSRLGSETDLHIDIGTFIGYYQAFIMKTLSKIAFSTALLFAAASLAAQTTVSYSNGTVERKQGVRFGVGTKQGMAIYISKEKAEQLKGSKIVNFEAAFSTSHCENLQFFITKQLGGEAEYTQKGGKTATRWTKYQLSTPYVITGEDFYVGYTCDVSTDLNPLLFDASKDFSNGLTWALNDDKWEDISNRGYGAGNLRFNVSEAQSFTDLIMKPVDASGYYKVGNGYAFGGQIYNFGNEAVHSFDLICQIGEGEPSTFHKEGLNIQPNEVYDFNMPEYFPTVNGKVPFKVTVANINGAADDAPADNISETSTYIYPEDMQKKVLIECFTTQVCGNCPNGHIKLGRALEGIEEDFVEVAHHSGYQIDAYTMQDDYQYTWFYNSNSTYAPGIMFNRTPLNDGVPSVVFETQDDQKLRQATEKFRNTPPYVSVDLKNDYDEASKKCKITVKVHTYDVPSDNVHRLNLVLTQDSLIGTQSGAGGNYVHNHVFRGNLTGTWGEDIDLVEGETFEKTYEYVLPDVIQSTQSKANIPTVAKNMNLVAFVSDATTSPLTCHVYNAAAVKMIGDVSTGIASAPQVPEAQINVFGNQVTVEGKFATATVYNMLGQKVQQTLSNDTFTLAKGIYVIAIAQNNGKVTSQKVYISK